MNMDQGACQRLRLKPLEWRGFARCGSARGKILESAAAECSQGVHRKCRKAVLGSQFSVLSLRWSVSIRCMEGEEFSGDFMGWKLLSGKDEWDQSVGQRQRTEGSLLVIRPGRKKF
jgi:hypothetical protein